MAIICNARLVSDPTRTCWYKATTHRPDGTPCCKKHCKSDVSALTSVEVADLGCCSICLCDMNDKSSVRTLPCKHRFHKACVNRWCQTNNTCPCCRKEIPTNTNATRTRYERQRMARVEQRRIEIERRQAEIAQLQAEIAQLQAQIEQQHDQEVIELRQRLIREQNGLVWYSYISRVLL